MDLNFSFRNAAQREFYYSTARNQCFSGAFNNGKSFAGCFKILTLLLAFPNYRVVVARQTYKDLKITTMQSFLKMCPSELIAQHNEQDGMTSLTNSSLIHWIHLDKVDEKTLRGLETNSYLVDQAEETDEKTMDILDARLGRWDGAIVPDQILEQCPNWPRDPYTNKPVAPSYGMLLTNPDTEFHYIYRKFHPLSPDRKPSYFYTEGSWDKTLGSIETYNEALTKDQEWVDKYVLGKWGRSTSAIHFLPKEGLLDYSQELIDKIKRKGNLYRILDHGDSSPTCCLWFAVLDGVYICYREYYVPGQVITRHRQNIYDLSEGENYAGNYADPQIFKKTSQKDGGFWSVADEYLSADLGDDIPKLAWMPADNNEFATRNRINELLRPSSKFKHPVFQTSPALGLYFVQKSPNYPYGCRFAIRELGAQRKKLLGQIEGKSFYSDEREDSITDHAYDCVRYFIAIHGNPASQGSRRPAKNTFAYYNMLLMSRNQSGPIPGSVQ